MLNVTARQDLMSKIIETLGVVVEDARFDFGENGLEIRVVDPSHVAMIQMNIDSAAFDTWELDETKLGLELRKIKELVSLGGPTDMIEMAYGDETGVLTVNLGKIDRNIRPLDNTTMNPPTLPELKLPCKVTISGSDFTQALKAARQVGDLVNFSIDENRRNNDGQALAIFNSSLNLEIAIYKSNPVNFGTAASLMGLNILDSVTINFK